MTSFIPLLSALFIGAFIVYLTIPIVVKVSKAKKLFDIPDERKLNKIVIPNLGGISIFIGISIATLLSLGTMFFTEIRFILVGMIIMLFIGIKDDIMVISPRKKFFAQIVSALILIIIGNIRLTNLHGILGINEINYFFSICVSILAIVAIINAINLIDGIDGLAAGIGILISLTFGILFLSMGHLPYGIICFAISGSLITFSFYNLFGKTNKIFMGDTGSLILGLLFAVFVIRYNELALEGSEQVSKFSPALSMSIIAIPFFDMIRVFCIRILQKKSPVFPDMNHIHHKLLRLGYSHLKTTIILLCTNLLFIGFVFFISPLNNNLQLILLFSIAIIFSFIPDLILKHQKYINSLSEKQFTKISFETISINSISKQGFQKRDYSRLKLIPREKSKEKEPEEAIV